MSNQNSEPNIDIVKLTMLESIGELHSDISEDSCKELATAIANDFMKQPVSDVLICMDGRSCAQMNDGSQPLIAAKSAGGNLVTMFTAHKVAQTEYISELETQHPHSKDQLIAFATDMKTQFGEQPVAHIGCGAAKTLIDSIVQMKLQNESLALVLKIQSHGLFDDDSWNALGGTAEQVAEQLSSDGYSADWILEAVEATTGLGGIEELDTNGAFSGHTEEQIVHNTLADMTIDRERLFKDTERKVFSIDEWAINNRAKKHAKNQQEVIKLTLVANALPAAVYSRLGDGSHLLGVLS